ncbi:MAG: hypothetical protein IJ323_06450 [Clostridia bacterium]|nr:hypothetical protein [Clostridia bacterium]
MNEKINAFLSLIKSEEVKKKLGIGEKLKKLDKSNDKRLMGVILLSIVSMTLLGFFALGKAGALIFFAITVIASFWLYYSSKKNMLLKYLSFYRREIPSIIAMAEGCEVKAENVPENSLVTSLSDGKPVFRMCHKYGDLYVGFLKFMKGDVSKLQGFVCYTEGSGDTSDFEENYKEEYPDLTIKTDGTNSLLFIPGCDDYLGGRIEMKDDLSEDFLTRQYKYYLMADAYKKAVKG